MKNKKLYPWIVVGLLWVVALLNYMDRQMLSTMKSAMMVDIVELESAANFGRLMAVFLWIYGFMSPVAGMVCLVLRDFDDGVLHGFQSDLLPTCLDGG